MSYTIAIDGPAGAGKSTIARAIARKLGYIYVDTGAMYRAMGLFIMRKGIRPEESRKISEACQDAAITIEYKDGEQIVILNGENVNPYIRTEEAGNMASAVSVNQAVREKLVELQRELASKTDVVMDGRDIGTCVLPDADVKVFLTAGTGVRARRRYEELAAKGIACDIEAIEKDIIERDNRDCTREISPLKQAEDAVLLDSSEMTVEQVIDSITDLLKGAAQ